MSDSWLRVRVERKHQEALNIFSMDLVTEDGCALPAFTAGAHIDVEVSPGMIRQYSLCGDTRDSYRYRIAVLREQASRGGSQALCERVNEGESLRIGKPRNHFPLVTGVRHTVLVAAGIGITPILSMAEELSRAGQSFELHYCARGEQRCAFRQHLLAAPYRDRVHLYLDGSTADYSLDVARVVQQAGAGAHLYVCGPVHFIEQVLADARGAGLPETRLHREFFSAPEETSAHEPDQAFTVRLASSGQEFVVPEGQSIAAVLQQAGVPVELSCEQGVCGSCLTGLCEGNADHRDYFQTDAEKAADERVAICCSRARSPVLVLDL